MNTSVPRRGSSPFNSSGETTAQSRPSDVKYTSQQSSRKIPNTDKRRTALDSGSTDTASDKNTVSLIRRVLCPEAPLHGSSPPQHLQELLPPLTSSNSVDLQLYALIAVIIKEFVYSWYAKITPDHVFVDEVLQLIAHCTRALEQRLRRVDVGQLVLDEIAGLVQGHVAAYRIATQDSKLVNSKVSTREVYHSLNPHPALASVADQSTGAQNRDQDENENIYRHLLAQGVLAVLLPTEDLENVCLRTLVEDVLSDLILGNQVSGRVCEGWFIWTTISKVITVLKEKDSEAITTTGKRKEIATESSRLERFGLLSDDRDDKEKSSKSRQHSILQLVWNLFQYIYLVFVAMRFIFEGLLQTAFSNVGPSNADIAQPIYEATIQATQKQRILSRPVLSYRAPSLVTQLLKLPQRMPWLNGATLLAQSIMLTGPGQLGGKGSILDRYLQDMISTYILTPTILPVLLFTVRTTLFPSNGRPVRVSTNATHTSGQQSNDSDNDASFHLGLSSQGPEHQADDYKYDNKDTVDPAAADGISPPSPSEAATIKRQCAMDILSLIPSNIARAFFGRDGEFVANAETTKNDSENRPNETLLKCIENDLLEPFSDAYCNKHLVYAIVEMVLIRLIPELTEQSVTALMEERGIVL